MYDTTEYTNIVYVYWSTGVILSILCNIQIIEKMGQFQWFSDHVFQAIPSQIGVCYKENIVFLTKVSLSLKKSLTVLPENKTDSSNQDISWTLSKCHKMMSINFSSHQRKKTFCFTQKCWFSTFLLWPIVSLYTVFTLWIRKLLYTLPNI